jgi:DNA-binding transcriptional LysR family regulator
MHPAVTIRVDVSDSLTVMNRVRENIYETAFCGVMPDGQDLGHIKIGGDEIVLIANREHPFAGKTEVRPEELSGEPFIFREDTSGTQRSLEKMLEKSGLDISKLTPRLVLGSTQAVVSAVAAGAGIAFISSLAIKNGCSPAVKLIPMRGLHFNRDFYCIFRRDKITSRIGDEFKSFMQIETGVHA